MQGSPSSTPRAGSDPAAPALYFTEKQLRILHFLRAFIAERGVSPTLDEIAGHFGISKVTAHEHVRALERKGVLRRVPHHARSIELADDPLQPPPSPRPLPILGTIAAGSPIDAVQDQETFVFEDWLRPQGEFFALRVRGDSMIEDGIHDGDLVVIERRSEVRDGEVVVALLEGREATLKRFYHDADGFRLQPANSSMAPILVDHLDVQGVVVGLLRRIH